MRRLGLFFIFSLGISLFTFLPLHTQAQSQEVLVLEAILQDGSTAPPAEARQEGGTASNPGEQGETS